MIRPEFKKVVSSDEINTVAALAHEIWHEHFTPIIGTPQVEYMLNKFQSTEPIQMQIDFDGYTYYLMLLDGKSIGYTAIKQEEESLFLSKIYILAQHRGNGYASRTFAFLKDICKENGLKKIWLTVNKNNASSIAVYKKIGFVIERAQTADIGHGFVMDDYVMELKIN